MDKSDIAGRKRIPLASLSPSASSKHVSKRRAGSESYNGGGHVNIKPNTNVYSQQNSMISNVTNENQNPNVSSPTLIRTGSSNASPSSRKLFQSGYTLQEDNVKDPNVNIFTPKQPVVNRFNSSASNPSGESQKSLAVPASGTMFQSPNPIVVTQKSLVVPASGTTFQTPVSRLITKSSVVNKKKNKFHLPTSRITQSNYGVSEEESGQNFILSIFFIIPLMNYSLLAYNRRCV